MAFLIGRWPRVGPPSRSITSLQATLCPSGNVLSYDTPKVSVRHLGNSTVPMGDLYASLAVLSAPDISLGVHATIQ